MAEKLDYKQGLLKNSRLTEIELQKLTKAVMYAAQLDMLATDGKAFHLLEGKVVLQEDGTFIYYPNKFMKKLIEERDYPAVLKIEEMRLRDWIIALMDGGNDKGDGN